MKKNLIADNPRAMEKEYFDALLSYANSLKDKKSINHFYVQEKINPKDKTDEKILFPLYFIGVIICFTGNFGFLIAVGAWHLLAKSVVYLSEFPHPNFKERFETIKWIEYNKDLSPNYNYVSRTGKIVFDLLYEKYQQHKNILIGINLYLSTSKIKRFIQHNDFWNENMASWLIELRDEGKINIVENKEDSGNAKDTNIVENKKVIKEVNQIKFGDGWKAYREEKLKGIDEQYKDGKNKLTDEEREKMYQSVKDYKDGEL